MADDHQVAEHFEHHVHPASIVTIWSWIVKLALSNAVSSAGRKSLYYRGLFEN